jgi:hypothetical protein
MQEEQQYTPATMPPEHISAPLTPPPTPPAAPPTNNRGRKIFFWIFLVLIFYLIITVISSAFVAYNLRQAKTAIDHIQAKAKVYDIDGALNESAIAEKTLLNANKGLLTLTPLRIVPKYGIYITSAITITKNAGVAIGQLRGVGEEIKDALGEQSNALFSPSSAFPDDSFSYNDLTPEEKERLIGVVATSAPKIKTAITALNNIDSALETFNVPEIANIREQIQTATKYLNAALPLLEYAPKLLGYPNGERILMFFANNTELRPTGGFLGVVGVANIKNGDVGEVDLQDVYDYDGALLKTKRPPAPEPFQTYINVKEWFLRDSNWSPDFVDSTKTMVQFFEEAEQAAGKPYDPPIAIIQFTPTLIEKLMDITGPITVQGITFNRANLILELEYAVEFGFVEANTAYDDRKAIVGELGKAFMERMKNLAPQQWLAVFKILEQEFREGQIMVVSNDPELQSAIDERGWAGRLLPVQGDYVSVIDANLGGLKSDPKVIRTVNYTIIPDNQGGYLGKVAMQYNHIGTFDLFTSRYRTYTRLYVPTGSTFVSVSGSLAKDQKVDVVNELGRVSFGTFTSIEPKTKRTLEFTFKLAPAVVQMIRAGSYHLDVQKQKGTIAHGLTLDLNFGKPLRSAVPPEDPKQYNDTHYRFLSDLRTDRSFDVGF